MHCSLTPEQEAVATRRGSAIVSAVAGSGKSETLLHLIERRVRSGADPRTILVVMYNRSARDGFQARLRARLKDRAPLVFTFHGLGHRICQAMEAEGILPTARLAEADQLAMLAKRAIQRANPGLSAVNRLDETDPEVQAAVLAAIDQLKNTNEAPPAPFDRVAEAFETERRAAGLRTFNDLILDPLAAIQEDPHAAPIVTGRYQTVLIDEFQDINFQQMQLMRILAGQNAEVIAVGDDDQAIYAWRGARAEYQIRGFEKLFPKAVRLTLSRTFRYGHTLALAANSLIRHNRDRQDKRSVSAGTHPTAISLRFYGQDAGVAVIDALHDWQQAGRSIRETALLVRQFAHALPIEFALYRHRIPWRIEGAEPFFRRPEVLALRGWLALAAGGFNDATPLEVMDACLRLPGLYLKHRDLAALIDRITAAPRDWLSHLDRVAEAQSPAVRSHIQRLAGHYRAAAQTAPSAPAHDYLTRLMKQLGVLDALKKRYPVPEQLAERQGLLAGMTAQAKAEGLSIEALAAQLAGIDRAYEADNPDALLILSMHRAKGLEWPHVLVGPLAEGEFPSHREDVDVDDERRLMYVAMTRAREQLTLLAPQDARLATQLEDPAAPLPSADAMRASRFLFEAGLGVAVAAGAALATGRPLPAPVERHPEVLSYLAAAKE